ncbi:MAG: anti-sigma F factor [Clostridia bacterium]|nr:anti-sigma F factor [Clostridia bacterium]
MDNYMELSFPSLSVNEGFARTAAAAFAAQLDPTIDQLSDLRTAVSEAVTNAIIHAYGSDPAALITLRCEREGRKIRIMVKDTGCGIADIELARRPFYTSKPELERSGMGFAVMEAFMDRVEIDSAPGEGTTVVMEKELEGRRGG